MGITSVTFQVRKVTGKFEHEEIMVENSFDANNPKSGDELLEEAKALALKFSSKTGYSEPVVTGQATQRPPWVPTGAPQSGYQKPAYSGPPRTPGRDPLFMAYAVNLPYQAPDKDQCVGDLKAARYRWSPKKDGGDNQWHGDSAPPPSCAAYVSKGPQAPENKAAPYSDDDIPF